MKNFKNKLLRNKIKTVLISIKKAFVFLFILSFFISAPINIFSIINVTTTDELIDAINTANSVPDSIQFTANITLTKPLPAITNTYTIDGDDGTARTLDGASTFRGFIIVGSGNSPTIQDLKIQNTKALGGTGGTPSNKEGGSGGGGLGAGGAIYVGDSASVTLSNITYDLNNATGGDGGPLTGTSGTSGGSGGGGLGGDGDNGTGTAADGGGGGGIKEWDGTSGGGSTIGDASGRTGGGLSPYDGADGANSVGPANATTPGIGGGGGGGAEVAGAGAASAGAFGGGGGGGSGHATDNINAAVGGFGGGGGGGGGASGAGGTSPFGGGAGDAGGATVAGQGGGGAGLGGAIFIDDSATATILDSTYDFSTNSVTAGTGANPGTGAGIDIFLATGGTLIIDTTGTFTVSKNIEADTINATGGVTVTATTGSGGTVNFAGRTNAFGGAFTLTEGTVQFNSTGVPFGNATGITFPAAGAASTKVLNGLTGGTITLSTPITMTGDGTITKDIVNQSLNITSAITGTGVITVDGAGFVTPTVSNPSFSGGWKVDGGILQITATDSIGTGDIEMLNSGTYRSGNPNVTISANNINLST
ncbi:MAG: hypothetical protein K1060chlam3_00001, partial [Candidatus Anoxychlamydiales bacterium]|nr:hypothetical protein [Candidatus Anoxychlamydiales bacterium]